MEQGASWVGINFFHLVGEAATPHPTGSGDTALQYVLDPCLLVCAVLGGVGWTLLSELWSDGRREYPPGFPAEHWSNYGSGFMVQTNAFGLVLLPRADEDLEFVGRAMPAV